MKNKTKKGKHYMLSKNLVNEAPYTLKFMKSPKQLLEELKNTRIVTINNGKYKKIIQHSYTKDYYITDGISTHLTEDIKIPCSYNNKTLPKKTLKNTKQIITNKCESDNITCINSNINNIKIYETFNPVIIIYFIRLVAKIQNISTEQVKILDTKAEWGDRLIGAIACNVAQYHSFDSNDKLQKVYSRIINEMYLLNSNNKQINNKLIDNYKVNNVEFENAKFVECVYNLVLISISYCELEKYTDRNQYKDKKKYMKQTWSGVGLDGLLVIYMDNIGLNSLNDKIKKLITTVIEESGDKFKFSLYGYRSEQTAKPNTILVWQKLAIKSNRQIESSINPPLVISTYNISSSKKNTPRVIVFRDDLLKGGTKQRALYEYIAKYILKHKNKHTSSNTEKMEFIYASPRQGYAQIALSYVAKLCNVKATVILGATDYNKLSMQTMKAKEYGVNIIERKYPNRLADLQKYAIEYSAKDKNRILLPVGFGDIEFENILTTNIRNAVLGVVKPEEVKRLWLVAGSGTILKCLARIFKECEFHVVQVGKKLWPDQLGMEGNDIFNAKLYIAPEEFAQHAKKTPPYPSVTNYDAKLWQFVLKEGRDGDYIWNVGG